MNTRELFLRELMLDPDYIKYVKESKRIHYPHTIHYRTVNVAHMHSGNVGEILTTYEYAHCIRLKYLHHLTRVQLDLDIEDLVLQ